MKLQKCRIFYSLCFPGSRINKLNYDYEINEVNRIHNFMMSNDFRAENRCLLVMCLELNQFEAEIILTNIMISDTE